MIPATGIAIPLETISEICRRFRVRELAMFGSAARGELRAESDVDLMVDFVPGYHPGLGWFDLVEQLDEAFGRQVGFDEVSQRSSARRAISSRRNGGSATRGSPGGESSTSGIGWFMAMVHWIWNSFGRSSSSWYRSYGGRFRRCWRLSFPAAISSS